MNFIAERVGQWSSAPADSLAAGWAPLILEHVRKVQPDLHQALEKIQPPKPPVDGLRLPPSAMTLAEMEKLLILETLRTNDGNRERTAAMLGIGSRTLYRKLNEYGVTNGGMA